MYLNESHFTENIPIFHHLLDHVIMGFSEKGQCKRLK